MKMFENVIVRRPSKSLKNGIASNPELGRLDYKKALIQHNNYIRALKKCGVKVCVLEAIEKYPDSCFVEDVAICTKRFAMIASPGASSRKGEEKEIIKVIKKFYNDIKYIKEPGTLEGGDVMMVKDHFYIGLSKRTNREGAEQLIRDLKKYGMSGSIVEISEMLHLKSGLAYLGDNVLLVAGEFINNLEFEKFNKIIINEEEAYSANCIKVNDYVLMPAGYHKTKEKIEAAGFKVIVVETSEYRKVDGGLSCLSLRF
jgi:dimethylargininase